MTKFNSLPFCEFLTEMKILGILHTFSMSINIQQNIYSSSSKTVGVGQTNQDEQTNGRTGKINMPHDYYSRGHKKPRKALSYS
jgi:hypothetical protein